MRTPLLLLSFWCVSFCVFGEDVSEYIASDDSDATVEFSLTCHRNERGHWTADLDSRPPYNDRIPLGGKIVQSNAVCGDALTVSIQAAIKVPINAVIGSEEKRRQPPADYVSWNEFRYYKFHPEAKTWVDARDACADEGAHLAVLNSEGEAKFVAGIWNGKSEWAYIGTNDLYNEGVQVTIFGDTLDDAGYNKWVAGEPNGGTLENCGLVNVNSLLGNYFCYLPMPFVCEFSTEDPSSVTPEKRSTVPADYKWFENSFYKSHPEAKSWMEARVTCANEGGHLAVINSEGEAKFVTSLWNAKSEWVYIGTHDFYIEGTYMTIFNETLDAAGYNKWVAGEPNGGIGENCGLINRNSLLGNYFCERPMPFICEIDSREDSTTDPTKVVIVGNKHLPLTGYTWFDNGYYKAHPEPKSWREANHACAQEGAHLLVINSEGEAKFATSLWTFKSEWAYIGFHDLYQEGLYVTIFNQTLEAAGYDMRYPGEPNGGTRENCGMVNRNSLLGNGFCELPAPFICEFDFAHAPSHVIVPIKHIPNAPPIGYTDWPHRGYYKAHPEAKTWVEARDTCSREGAHLAVINSAEEAKFVTSLPNFKSQWAYIGTHDLYKEGPYVTIFNQTLDAAGYNKWVAGEPNGGIGENCGLINRNTLLGNYFCERPMPFICEFGSTDSSSTAVLDYWLPVVPGYTYWPGLGSYKSHPQPKDWSTARQTCAEEGAHLAVINSDAEAKIVASLWNTNSDWAYIGTHDLQREGLYMTIFDETLDVAGYNKWVVGEPNGGTAENCGLINKNTLLGNYFCQRPMPFICEIN